MNVAAELAQEVQELLERYVKGVLALDLVQDALDALAPRLSALPNDKYAVKAVDQVEILFAELFRGDRSEDEVRELIRDELLLPSVEVINNSSSSVTATQSGATPPSVLVLVA